MLKEALMHAKAARGTDDSANDWLVEPGVGAGCDPTSHAHDGEESSGVMNEDPYEEFEVQDPGAYEIPSHAYAQAPHDPPADYVHGLFTLTVHGPMANHIEVALNPAGMRQYLANASENDTTPGILDEITWRKTAEHISTLIND